MSDTRTNWESTVHYLLACGNHCGIRNMKEFRREQGRAYAAFIAAARMIYRAFKPGAEIVYDKGFVYIVEGNERRHFCAVHCYVGAGATIEARRDYGCARITTDQRWLSGGYSIFVDNPRGCRFVSGTGLGAHEVTPWS